MRPVFTPHCFAESDQVGWSQNARLHFKSKKVEMPLKPLRYKQLRRNENATTGVISHTGNRVERAISKEYFRRFRMRSESWRRFTDLLVQDDGQ